MNRDRIRRSLLAPLLTSLILLAGAAAAEAATITVNVTNDPAGPGACLSGGQCSLRQAVGAASPNDVVDLGSNTYTLTQGTNVDITTSLTLQGAGVGATKIDGSQNFPARILRVDGAQVTIQDLTLTGGTDEADEVPCNTCETISLNGGGALWNDGGTVSINRVAFADNPGGPAPGGAVSNSGGSLNLTDVSFTNDQGAIGGALFTHSGTVNGDRVLFEDDDTGCCDISTVYLLRGNVSLQNTTVVGSGGAASIAGGIHNGAATLTLTNDTLSDNVRGSLMTDTSGITNVTNTIIANGFTEGGDGDCIAPGQPDDADDQRSGNAITNDLGGNLDQDNSCGLSTAKGDVPNADPKLASIADNGGPTQTEALVFGSPALGAADEDNCPTTDQRDKPRADPCDIGAFEAQFTHQQPSATTEAAQNIGQTQADLGAQINFGGEAGGLHFLWGTSPDQLTNVTGEAGEGVISSSTPVSQTLGFLDPGTTYYYEAVADNATGTDTDTSDVLHFTTLPGPPVIDNISVEQVTDTTATIDFTINPQGSDTTYVVDYGPDTNYGSETEPVDAGSAPGPKPESVTLTNLSASSTIHFAIVAGNGVQQDVTTDDEVLNTDEQVAGITGSPLEVDAENDQARDCPATASIDWGDGDSDSGVTVQCNNPGGEESYASYSLSATHTYGAAGHYPIQIDFDNGDEDDVFAQVSNPTPPAVSGVAPSSGPTAGGTSVTITGSGLTNASEVDFGSTPASSLTVDNDNEVTAIAPPGSAGPVDVTVTTPLGTSPTSSSDTFTYQAPPPAQTPPAQTPPAQTPPTQAPPAVSGGAPTNQTNGGATPSGTVNPEGITTQAFFQYGIDLSQRGPGADTTLYDQSTPPQPVGSDATAHTVTASLTGLIPGALYHVRLVAINSAGTTFGPDQTFTAAQAPAPPPPVLGKSEDVKPVSGRVFIRTAGGQFIPLTGAAQIPSGTVIDALHGSLQLLANVGEGKTEHGTFGGAVFKVIQSRQGLTTLTLLESAFPGAPSYATCKAHQAGDASAAALSTKTLQLLHASAHGKFRTSGKYSAATVRGTIWTIADRCDGTLTHDITDSVAVQDFAHHKTIILHAGQSYLAHKP